MTLFYVPAGGRLEVDPPAGIPPPVRRKADGMSSCPCQLAQCHLHFSPTYGLFRSENLSSDIYLLVHLMLFLDPK